MVKKSLEKRTEGSGRLNFRYMQRFLVPESYVSFSMVFGEEEMCVKEKTSMKVEASGELRRVQSTEVYRVGENVKHGPFIETEQRVLIFGRKTRSIATGAYFNGKIHHINFYCGDIPDK